MNRRDFLRPRRQAESAGQVLGLIHELTSLPAAPSAEDVVLLRAGRRAMATGFEFLFPYGTPLALDAAEAGFDEIDRLEDQLTIYRDTSELSEVNRRAAIERVSVEPNLFELLSRCARLTAATDGAFDVTAGPLIKAWGFFRRQGRIPTEAERLDALARCGMHNVVLDADTCSVRFARPGIEINLGSIGKGYALDRAGHLLRQMWGIRSALLHGGGSSILAVGTLPGDPRGWLVGITHPWLPTRRLALVRLRDQGLATSAATHQHFAYNGKTFGHLLDPRTGRPAEGIASATAVAPTAATADALATAFFVRGVEWTVSFCKAHPGIGAVLLPDGSDAVPVVVGLPADSVVLNPPEMSPPTFTGIPE